MALTKLALCPDQAGYSAATKPETLYVELDGGSPRYRRDIIGATSLVDVSWTTSRGGYDYLKAFERTATANASLPFLIDLVLDNSGLEEYTAHFVPGTLRLSGVSGLQHIVSAQLDVVPLAVDTDYDNALIELFPEYGSTEDLYDVLNQLAILVNEELPVELS